MKRKIQKVQSENEEPDQILRVRIFEHMDIEHPRGEVFWLVIVSEGELGEFRRFYDSCFALVGNDSTSDLIGSMYDIFSDINEAAQWKAAGEMRSDPNTPTLAEVEAHIVGGGKSWSETSLEQVAIELANSVNDYGD